MRVIRLPANSLLPRFYPRVFSLGRPGRRVLGAGCPRTCSHSFVHSASSALTSEQYCNAVADAIKQSGLDERKRSKRVLAKSIQSALFLFSYFSCKSFTFELIKCMCPRITCHFCQVTFSIERSHSSRSSAGDCLPI